jgi:hypothetical protein
MKDHISFTEPTCLGAFTPAGLAPAFISVNLTHAGVEVNVRSAARPGEAYGPQASIVMTEDQFDDLIISIVARRVAAENRR